MVTERDSLGMTSSGYNISFPIPEIDIGVGESFPNCGILVSFNVIANMAYICHISPPKHWLACEKTAE